MDMKSYCRCQVEEAKKYKWIQSQKAGKDLGDAAVIEWVKKFAADFREDYNAAYKLMIEHVKVETIKELKKNNMNVDDQLVENIVNVSIDKFIDRWTVDMSKDSHNSHLELL